ncbi:hypothetical protein FTUN_1570 [Frigoriglobus tundricola]|uniref:Uncharacterized protein n=1 Tax=Frigoriglobus tundricola TaxID=2774151 RepID=A0A6M5YL93_9BACT|nr:hypothetical protein FTUN_1570 [Frigoriglobus tundricola]
MELLSHCLHVAYQLSSRTYELASRTRERAVKGEIRATRKVIRLSVRPKGCRRCRSVDTSTRE